MYIYLFVYQNRSNASAEFSQVNLFIGHRDWVWHVTFVCNGMQVIGTASPGKKLSGFVYIDYVQEQKCLCLKKN